MKVCVTVDAAVARGRVVAARKVLAEAVRRDCAGYVPRRSGTLAGSARVDGEQVVYDAPHAAAVYYGEGEGARWFERAKAAHGEAWVRAAEDALNGRGV